MATLYFKVSSDWEQVVKLRQECEKLETQLRKMDSRSAPAATKTLETQLASTKQQMMGLVTEAAKAGAEIENGFKKKIYDASQTVNGLSEKIIAQRAVIKDIEFDVKRLGDAYRTALKNNPIGASGKLAEYNAARKALDEEKAALFGLTQQQAEARLSVKKLRDEYSLYKKEAGDTVEINNGLSLSWGKMLGVIGGATALKSLASQIVRVRGEFQSMQTAIETMVGKDVASGIMAQLKEMAKISPLTLTDMVNAEKMMLGFNIQAEDTVRYLQALSDISMGDSVKFKSLTLAFSQMSAAGKLMGQDLNQMINAGFNPLQIIAEKTGKSIATLKNEMSKGAISAEMVQQAFIDATSSGGKFYQMSENASKTINGQLSMMQDALDNAFNEIGTASEGVIMKGIQVTTSLIENYETIGKVLVGLIATYGTYRGILIATTALEQAKNGTLITTIKNTKLATAAQAAFNKVVKAHPYALIASLAIGAATAIFAFSERTTKASKASAQLSANIKNETYGLDSLFKKLKSAKEGTDEREKAIEQINSKYGSYLSNLLSEKSSVEDIADAYEKAKKSIIDYNIEKSKNEYLQEPLSGLNKATQEFYESISNFSKELSNDEQKGRFKAYIDQIVDSVRNGGYFDINQVYTAFRAAQAKQSYKNVDEWLEAFRAGKEDFGISDTDIIDVVGGFDISNVTGAGKQLEAFSESLKKAKTEFDSFSKSYREVSSTANQEELPTSNISQEIENATSKIKSLKQEIADLRSGKLQAEAGKTVESAIKAKEKELQSAEKTLETLTGVSHKSENKKVVDNQQNLSDELLQLIRANQQEEINLMEEGSEKKRRLIELDYQREIDEIRKQRKKWEDAQGGKLTSEQREVLGSRASNAMTSREKGLAEITETENQAAIEANERYLKSYGTFMQKRDAIIAEYTRKISEATTQGDKDILQKEMDKALSSLDLEKLKQGINWELIFGDLDKVSKESLNKVKQQLREFKNSDEYKNMAVDQKKVVDEALSNIQSTLIDKGGLLADLPEQLSELAKAQEELSQAQEEYNEAMRSGTDEQKEAATKKLNDAQKRQQNAQVNVQKSTDKTTSNLVTLSNVITQLGSNSEISLSQVGDFAGNIVDIFAEESEKLGGIIGAAFSLLDAIGTQGLDGFIGNIFSSVFKSVGGIWDTLTFGGFSKLFGIGGNAKEVQEAINRLTDRNETLQTAIEDLTEVMQDVKGVEAIRVSSEVNKLQKETNENYKKIAQEQARYSGSHHSWNYYWRGFSQEQIDRLSEQIGRDWNGDLWDLSPEEMKILRSNVEMWEQIKNSGKGDYGERLTEKLDDYIEQAGKLDEITNTLYENLTGTTANDVFDDFLNSLYDLASGSEDVFDDIANNWDEMVNKMVIDNLIGANFQKKIEGWYEELAELNRKRAENEITDDEYRNQLDKLRNEYLGYVNDAKSDIEAMKDMGIITETESSKEQQSASGKGYATASQDSIDELSGRTTAMYESNLRIEAAEQQQTVAITELRGSISALTAQASGMYNIADETRTILANSYLELQQIRENTGEIVKPIKQMQADIAEVKRNTSRL